MYKIRKAADRGTTKNNWLDSKHTFSFAGYYDLNNMGFGPLRVINDDIVAPGGGFGLHPHDNMEIISIVLSGELQHKDSMGHKEVLHPGEIQKMSAGTGVFHSEYNNSDKEPVHFLQIWIMPSKRNILPSYSQKFFPDMLNEFALIASPDGRENSFKIVQDVFVYQTILEKEKILNYQVAKNRIIWIHIAKGQVNINNTKLSTGDGLGIKDEEVLLNITSISDTSNIILFDMGV